jgi:integrase
VSTSEVSPAIVQGKKERRNGDGTTFFDRKRDRWVASFYDINGIRRTQTFHKKNDADKWRIENITQREKGNSPHAGNPKETVAEFLARWLEYRSKRIRPNTYRTYDITIRTRINPYIGNERASKLKPIAIEKLADLLNEKEYSAGSILGVYRTLSKAYNDGVRLEWVPYSPMTKVERLKLSSSPSSPISKADTEKLFNEAGSSTHDLARLIVGVRFALRPGEVAGLRWSDLNIQNRTLSIERQVQYEKGSGLTYGPPKTHRKSALPLTDKEVQILLRHKAAQELNKVLWQDKTINSAPAWKGDDGIMFPNKHGNLQNSKSDTKWFHDLCVRANVQRYQRYQMRKKALTDLLLVADLGTVMAYSGHTQSSTLLRHYISPEISAVRKAAERREFDSGFSDAENGNLRA